MQRPWSESSKGPSYGFNGVQQHGRRADTSPFATSTSWAGAPPWRCRPDPLAFFSPGRTSCLLAWLNEGFAYIFCLDSPSWFLALLSLMICIKYSSNMRATWSQKACWPLPFVEAVCGNCSRPLRIRNHRDRVNRGYN